MVLKNKFFFLVSACYLQLWNIMSFLIYFKPTGGTFKRCRLLVRTVAQLAKHSIEENKNAKCAKINFLKLCSKCSYDPCLFFVSFYFLTNNLCYIISTAGYLRRRYPVTLPGDVSALLLEKFISSLDVAKSTSTRNDCFATSNKLRQQST